MESIKNHWNEWEGVVNTEKVKGPVPVISKEEVKKALASMHNGKASGRSGMVKEYFEYPYVASKSSIILQIMYCLAIVYQRI
mgnify:CR=1 FL=1